MESADILHYKPVNTISLVLKICAHIICENKNQ